MSFITQSYKLWDNYCHSQNENKRTFIMAKHKIEDGTSPAVPKYRISIMDKGPYLIYGQPPLATQHIVTNEAGESWDFKEGRHFSTEQEPTSLCRCGGSKQKPYCDGSHLHHKWNPRVTAQPESILENADITAGEELTLADNSQYCAFARFCDAGEGVWSATEASFDKTARRLAIHQASICPSGRLSIWGNGSDLPIERHYEPSLGLIEDDAMEASGGLWVRGGIAIFREDGTAYEVRNRTTLCRCGESANKPYCDGTHAALRWQDQIEESTKIAEKI